MSDEPTPTDRTAPTSPDPSSRTGRRPVTIDQHGRTQTGPGSPDPAAAANAPQVAEATAAGGGSGAGAAPTEAGPADQEPPPARSGGLMPMLGVVGFLILACAIGYVWYLQQGPSGDGGQVQALQEQVQTLDGQVTALQQAASSATAVKSLASRVDVLEHQKGPDLSQIEQRLSAVEHHQPAEISQLQSQVEALRQQVGSSGQISQRVDSLAQQVQSATSQSQQAEAALKQRLDTIDSRLTTLEQSAGRISKLADRATHLARLQAAQMALAQGHKLGDIPGAPGPLARYADTPPPTVASLRLSFPAAEQAAFAASSPDTGGKSFLDRVKAHAEELVTVRQGDHVLVGDATAGVLARARAALDAGDLASAVNAVDGLSGPPAQAMADWLTQAKALLAAQSALADMVAHA